MDQRGGFTRAGVVRGLKAALALTLGLSPFGLVVGMTADGVGLSLLETLLMSGLVFAGTSQLVALQLWSDPAPILAATLACLVINLRMAPMGAALAPVLDRTRGIRLWGSLALLVDNSFALTIAELRAGRRDAGFLFGASFGMWVNWMAMCAIGHIFGNALRLPAGHPIFFASSAAVLAILVQLWRGRSDLQPWLLAGAVALMAHGLGLGAPWPVLAGAFAGATLGAWRDTRGQA
ncbi:AzlC family ABC transporter permease [Roseicella aerolata]|uniref:AzlC family ABC transporter permease n=1 Tax=Roseicella aerolata TaxID=2883479 RepID=A0A9X1IJC5_9PROT|nr:AzlC family ABC transporter permease [Roseicella aerolata]MCB4824688.1 AzlC family ABC transporter permease [Roseicella aerolata]